MILMHRPEAEQCHLEAENISVPTCELQKATKNGTIFGTKGVY